MDEQAPSLSEPAASAPPTPPPHEPAATPKPARQRGGCVGRLLAALLVVIITTFLALAIGASGLLYLGFTPAAPRQLEEAQLQIATLQAQNNALLTQVAAHETRGTTDHEVLGDLKRSVDDLTDLRAQLRQERESSAAQSATLVADVRASRDSVALFATAEASRAALLAELERRSARVERFLQRLGDIANDTALDLANATPDIPTLTPSPAALPTPSATLVPTPAPTALSTATIGPSATPAATATSAATTTPAATRAATPRPSQAPAAAATPTATLGR
jgi:hypothetical protein